MSERRTRRFMRRLLVRVNEVESGKRSVTIGTFLFEKSAESFAGQAFRVSRPATLFSAITHLFSSLFHHFVIVAIETTVY
jgi:hypothetical protein